MEAEHFSQRFADGAELETVHKRLEELQTTGNTRSPEFFFLNLKRRTLENIDHGKQWNDGITIDDLSRQLARIRHEAKLGGTEEAQQTTRTLNWAFLALAARHDPHLINAQTIREYNTMQKEAVEKGDMIRGMMVPAAVRDMLSWMLEQVQLPHALGEGDICIPFAPLERQMHTVASAEGLAQPVNLWQTRDHESRVDTQGMMDAWQQTQDTHESS